MTNPTLVAVQWWQDRARGHVHDRNGDPAPPGSRTGPLAGAPSASRFATTTAPVGTPSEGAAIPISAQDLAEVAGFLAAAEPQARECAWEALLAKYSRLIYHVSRSFGGGHDATMDRYAFVLDRIQEDDHRRLRAFRLDGPARFTTWLVVVTRRLCLDHHRLQHGRQPASTDGAGALARAVRWRLAHDHGERVNLESIPDEDAEQADEALDRSDRSRLLATAVESLPAPDRVLLYLRYEQGLPAARIATAMGLPSAFHVYRRLRTVTTRLRAELEATGVDGTGA